MSTAGTWQPTTGYAPPENASLLQRVGVRARNVAADCRNVPRYGLKYGMAVLAIFGLLQLWQAGGDGPLPTFHRLLCASGCRGVSCAAATGGHDRTPVGQRRSSPQPGAKRSRTARGRRLPSASVEKSGRFVFSQYSQNWESDDANRNRGFFPLPVCKHS